MGVTLNKDTLNRGRICMCQTSMQRCPLFKVPEQLLTFLHVCICMCMCMCVCVCVCVCVCRQKTELLILAQDVTKVFQIWILTDYLTQQMAI